MVLCVQCSVVALVFVLAMSVQSPHRLNCGVGGGPLKPKPQSNKHLHPKPKGVSGPQHDRIFVIVLRDWYWSAAGKHSSLQAKLRAGQLIFVGFDTSINCYTSE